MSSDQAQPIASTSTASIPGTGDEKQIAIRLSTKDPLYTIPPAKFLVPASWRRFHLSELINKVLDNGQSPFLDLSSRDSGTTGGSLPTLGSARRHGASRGAASSFSLLTVSRRAHAHAQTWSGCRCRSSGVPRLSRSSRLSLLAPARGRRRAAHDDTTL